MLGVMFNKLPNAHLDNGSRCLLRVNDLLNATVRAL